MSVEAALSRPFDLQRLHPDRQEEPRLCAGWPDSGAQFHWPVASQNFWHLRKPPPRGSGLLSVATVEQACTLALQDNCRVAASGSATNSIGARKVAGVRPEWHRPCPRQELLRGPARRLVGTGSALMEPPIKGQPRRSYTIRKEKPAPVVAGCGLIRPSFWKGGPVGCWPRLEPSLDLGTGEDVAPSRPTSLTY